MLVVVVLFFILLTFPLFVKFDVCYIKTKNKMFYKISLFNVIKILKGYVELIKEGIVIHLTKRKAIIIPYKNIVGIRKKFKPLKDYHFIKLNSILEIGFKDDLVNSFFVGNVNNFIFEFVNWFFYHKKPYVNLKNKTLLFENDKRLNYFLELTVVFNMLMILVSGIKILMEKILYVFRNKAR